MNTISIRFEDEFLHDMESLMKENRYATKAEFIREAIRDKMKALERERALAYIDKIAGSSKKKTTDKERHEAGEKAAEVLARKFGVK